MVGRCIIASLRVLLRAPERSHSTSKLNRIHFPYYTLSCVLLYHMVTATPNPDHSLAIFWDESQKMLGKGELQTMCERFMF